jgi:uncharacterized damage-inducible protein DinB
MTEQQKPEPWLRGTLHDVAPVPRAVLHALELAREDIRRWCGGLHDEEWNARPAGVAPIAFHIRHIGGSIDRLLTYAEGGQLAPAQLDAMKKELDANADGKTVLAEFDAAMDRAFARVRAIPLSDLDQPRKVGRKQLSTTVAGLLVHIADHTQRHVGQAITTAKIVTAVRGEARA